MRIVLDTNVLLASLGTRSPVRWLFDALLAGRFGLVVSTPILLEYEEVIGRRATPEVAGNVLRALLALPSAERVEPRFRWQLPPGDPDDEKFVDALLAAGADAVVTNDRHFEGLTALDFPLVRVLTPEAFRFVLAGDQGPPSSPA